MSIYRNAVFLVKGMKEFTRSGYESSSRHFKESDLHVDLSSQVVMITGANSGIGKATALSLAEKGATVHMVCRNEERGSAAREEIVSSTGNEKVELHILDLSDPDRVLSFASDFSKSGSQLNVLVNNAGCMVNTREIDNNALEKNFATNTLGTHILTTTLLPSLEKQPGSRVITVSSGGMLTQRLQTSDLQSESMKPFDGMMVYAQNKRQQVVMMRQYATRYPSVFFASMHPGWADTPAVETSMPDFYNRMSSRFRTAEQGADTVVWLCVAEAAIKHPSGTFFFDRKPSPEHLPLAWTKSSPQDELQFMTLLDACKQRFIATAN